MGYRVRAMRPSLPGSPRLRRRLRWPALGLLLAAIAAVIVAIFPNYSGKIHEHFTSEPPQLVVNERQVPLRAKDRRAIDALLARFVPDAVARRRPGAAWKLATPGLRGGSSRADWARGDVPVLPFAARDAKFGGWSPSYSYRDEVSFELLLHGARSSGVSGIAYLVDVKRIHGHWLVDAFAPRASYASSAPARASSGTRRASPEPAASVLPKGHSPIWFAVPGVLIGLPLLALLGVALLRWRRGVRAERLYRARAGA
jgi:hypothetical protein